MTEELRRFEHRRGSYHGRRAIKFTDVSEMLEALAGPAAAE